VTVIRGELTGADYLSAQWLHMKPRRGYRIAGYVVMGLFGVALLLVTAATIAEGDPHVLLTFCGPVFVLAAVFASKRHQLLRIYRRQIALQGEHRIEFSSSGLRAESSRARGELSWSMFIKYREGEEMFLLYQADNLFHMLPKRWFQGSAAIQAFRDLLQGQQIRSVD